MTDQAADAEARERRLRKELAKAGHAERIFDDPLFVETVKAVENDLLRDLQTNPLDDGGASLMEVRHQLDSLKNILVKLRTYADGGKVAKDELSRLEKMGERLRSTFAR